LIGRESWGNSKKESGIYDVREGGQKGTRKGHKEVRVEVEEMREESSQTKREN
jgi:hypothetical protein